jgi:hypothetical protein
VGLTSAADEALHRQPPPQVAHFVLVVVCRVRMASGKLIPGRPLLTSADQFYLNLQRHKKTAGRIYRICIIYLSLTNFEKKILICFEFCLKNLAHIVTGISGMHKHFFETLVETRALVFFALKSFCTEFSTNRC